MVWELATSNSLQRRFVLQWSEEGTEIDARMRAPSVRLLPDYRLRPEESEWALKLRLSISAIRRDGRTCTLGLQPYRRRASPSCQPATTEAILGKASVASRRQRSLTNSE